MTHLDGHGAHGGGVNLGQLLQERHHHVRMQAQVHVRVVGLAPTFGERILERGNRPIGQVRGLKYVGEFPEQHLLLGGLHVGVVFHRIGYAQVQVRKQDAPVEPALEHVDVEREGTRNMQQDFLGVQPRLLAFEDLLAHAQ